MRRHVLASALISLVLISLACSLATPAPSTTSTTASGGQRSATPGGPPTQAPGPGGLGAFSLDLSQPFVRATPLPWSPAPYAGPAISLPLDLGGLANAEVLAGLTDDEKTFLAQNGFVVIRSGEAQFNDIRYTTAYALGQPYFRTVDEAFHALHLQFDDLLKALEVQDLQTQMLALLTATRDQVRSYASQAQGTPIESDTVLAEAYLEVAIHLFDPSAPPSQVMPDLVAAQLKQIMDAGGRDHSALFPDFEDDYGAYTPVGHYAGDPVLEGYFRGMTWLGRVHFALADAENPAFQPSRLPLILTLALRQAQVGGQPASQSWSDANRLLDFLIGPTDDLGPLEYSALMDQVYGSDLTFAGLADDATWQTFLASTADLPAPQINSTFVNQTAELQVDKGWRMMGQRFTMDANIFQTLIFDKVQPRADGTRREFPTGLDVMAVFGSGAATQALQARGDMSFPNYPQNLADLTQAAAAQPESEWLGRAYSAWLYSMLPVVGAKDSDFPSFMQTAVWGFKDLNAALGSWAELKHDTVLYTKMPEAAGGGGPPMSGPAPSYVEPNPHAFYRLAYVARAIGDGVQARVDLNALPADSQGSPQPDLPTALDLMTRLAGSLEALGTAAARELAGQDLGDLAPSITDCLGFHECAYTDTGYNQPQGDPPVVPIVAAVSGSQDSVLEAATGLVDRIYVIVPLEGGLEAAQGGVFSYYEFTQPRDQRLTDDAWRHELDDGSAPTRPAWADAFSLPGGQVTEALRFRVGDIYLVTPAGDRYNLRASPSPSAPIVGLLAQDSYLTITGGPVTAGGHQWWQVRCEYCSFLDGSQVDGGWLAENPDWLARSYRP